MTKQIETKLVLTAVDKYSSVLKGMERVTGKTATGIRTQLGEMQKLRGPIRMIGDFGRMRETVSASAKDLAAARERVRQLHTQLTTTKAPTAALRREFDGARRALDRMEKSHKANLSAMGGLRAEMIGAGINVRDLAGEQQRLVTTLDRTSQGFDRQVVRMKALAEAQDRMAAARELFDERMGRAANLGIAGMATRQAGRRLIDTAVSPVQKAIAMESAFADVRKVIDFSGPEEETAMRDRILDLSTRIPMAAEGLTQIVAAGGQSGIARDDLAQFAEMAAKIGVAFDISADTAGTAMAEIKTQLSTTLDETGRLFDAMNHISNSTAASAPDVLEFMRRAGDMGSGFGMSRTQSMAMGSAMIAGGAAPDVAFTSFKNAGQALMRGGSATKAQKDALGTLGLDATDVAKRMVAEGPGTMIDVIERLKTLPDYLQASVKSDLFGNEARGLDMLINNLDLYRQSLALVATESDYVGSAQKEYEERSKTTANNLELMHNQLSAIGITIGDMLLPAFNDLLKVTGKIIRRMSDWAREHPRMTRAIALGTVAIGAATVAIGGLLTAASGALAAFALFRFGLAGIGIKAGLAAGALRGLGGATTGFGPALRGAEGFAQGLAGQMDAAALSAESAKARINAAARAIRWKGFLATVGMGAALARLPDDPAKLNEVLNANKQDFEQKMGWAMGNLPGLKQLVAAQNSLRGLVGLAPMEGTPGGGDALAKTADGLKGVGTEAEGAKGKADDLKSSLVAVDQTVVEPTISTLSIDEARAAIRGLSQEYQSLVGRGAVRPPERGEPGSVQARASGGSFGRGPVLVGERGPEAWFANRGGFIAHNRQLREMLRTAGLAASIGAALPAPAAVPQGRAPAAIGTLNITIPITMPAGSGSREVVEAVRRDLGREVSALIADRFAG